ncbi:hypothetical protein N0V90_001420 [Kalmusia sp. IMI 367209]|nr:hypothetical protein N0V90_001420 [Kalmusia sp. IMI 367209]
MLVSQRFTHNRPTTRYISPSLAILNTFEPVAELHRRDADIVLKFIAKNRVLYTAPVEDPIFQATLLVNNLMLMDGSTFTGMYAPNSPLGVIGCAQQVSPIIPIATELTKCKHQLCIPSMHEKGTACTKLGPLPGDVSEIDLAPMSDMQRSIMQLLISAAWLFDIGIWDWVSASSGILDTGGQSYGLPNDQWMREVVMWESSTWAALQVAIAQYALGPPELLSGDSQAANTNLTTTQRRLCKMQRVRRSGGFV